MVVQTDFGLDQELTMNAEPNRSRLRNCSNCNSYEYSLRSNSAHDGIPHWCICSWLGQASSHHARGCYQYHPDTTHYDGWRSHGAHSTCSNLALVEILIWNKQIKIYMYLDK